jgi:CDP-glycerol glycerophosphotransferase
VDVSKFHDMQVLLSASDVVISDYSSLMFDFAISKKPCFQFATDIEAYKQDRNFYFSLDKLPFSVAKNNDELVKDISEFNQENYQNALDAFFNEVGMILDGKASEKCASIIEDICFNKE